MRLIVLRLMLALAAFTIVPDALADANSGNFFLDAKYGTTFGKMVSNDAGFTSGSQPSWGADGGYLWRLKDEISAGVDIGYMQFGHIADEFSNLGGLTQESASAMTVGGRLMILTSADKTWFLQARFGYLSLKFDASNYPYSYSWRQSGVYFGGGIGRNITQNLSLILAYDHNESNNTPAQYSFGPSPDINLNWIGLAAEYRF